MIKYELKNAYAFVGEEALGECALPFSLFSALRGFGNGLIPDEPREQQRKQMLAARLSIKVEMPEAMRSLRAVALCLKGLVGRVRVCINGKTVARYPSAPASAVLALDVREDFLLELCFEEREVPMDVGLLGGAELVGLPYDMITEVYTEQQHRAERCELFIRFKTLLGSSDAEAFATLYSPSGEMHYVGFASGEAHISLPAFQRFSPVGLGVPGLYRLVVTLYHEGAPADSFETTVGLRKLTFAKDGESVPFALTVDDLPYFVKAARITAHPGLDAAAEQACFARALPALTKMECNALVVDAKTGFLSDASFSLCDRHGILVLQQLPMPEATDEAGLNEYFAQMKVAIGALINHPSLALLLLPDGVSGLSELGRAIKGFFAFSFPYLAVRGVPALGLADIAHLPSMPSTLAVRRYLPMEARRIFSYAMESAQENETQIVSMLSEAAHEYPYGAGLDDVCYLTALSSADAAEAELDRALTGGVLGGFVGGTLFEGGISMKPSLMDGLLQHKALYFDLKTTFAPVFLFVKAQGTAASVRISAMHHGVTARLVTTLMDRSNRPVGAPTEDIVEVPVGSSLELKKALPEAAGHEREYYVLVSAFVDGGCVAQKAALFVPSKHFRFVYPDIRCEIKGSGKSYELTLSASAYVRRLRIAFSKTAVNLTRNYFDIYSDAKILIPFETDEVTTPRHLEAQLRLRSLYDVGRITERDLADEQDIEALNT